MARSRQAGGGGRREEGERGWVSLEFRGKNLQGHAPGQLSNNSMQGTRAGALTTSSDETPAGTAGEPLQNPITMWLFRVVVSLSLPALVRSQLKCHQKKRDL